MRRGQKSSWEGEQWILAQELCYTNSCNPKFIQIITALDYHMMERKENGNGLMDAHLECEFLEFIH
jgi:hypothetical protein